MKKRYLMLLAIIVIITMVGMGYALTGEVIIKVSTKSDYHSFTVGVPCVCDVYIECDGSRIINQTVISYIWNESNYRWGC